MVTVNNISFVFQITITVHIVRRLTFLSPGVPDPGENILILYSSTRSTDWESGIDFLPKL